MSPTTAAAPLQESNLSYHLDHQQKILTAQCDKQEVANYKHLDHQQKILTVHSDKQEVIYKCIQIMWTGDVRGAGSC